MKERLIIRSAAYGLWPPSTTPRIGGIVSLSCESPLGAALGQAPRVYRARSHVHSRPVGAKRPSTCDDIQPRPVQPLSRLDD
jgi:hypothetical protein